MAPTPTDLRLVTYAKAAYEAKPDFSVSGDLAAIARRTRGGTQIVAFRGTEIADLENIAVDLAAWPAWRKGLGWCHGGFLHGAEAFLKLPAFWDVAVETTRPRVFVGHSLGGALALLAAALAKQAGKPPVLVATFGAPRPGFARLAAYLASIPIRRFEHAGDPVPTLPRRFWPFDYRTPGSSIMIGAAEPDPISNHLLETYIEALESQSPKSRRHP